MQERCKRLVAYAREMQETRRICKRDARDSSHMQERCKRYARDSLLAFHQIQVHETGTNTTAHHCLIYSDCKSLLQIACICKETCNAMRVPSKQPRIWARRVATLCICNMQRVVSLPSPAYIYRALLSVCRALLSVYRALFISAKSCKSLCRIAYAKSCRSLRRNSYPFHHIS